MTIEKKLLQSLEVFLKEYDDVDEISAFTAEELNAPMDVLRAIFLEFGSELNAVLGEFCFLPIGGEDGILYFSTVLTLKEQLPKEAAAELAPVIAKSAPLLPLGSFGLGGGEKNALIFRYTVPVLASASEEQKREQIETAADLALSSAESICGYLFQVIDGRLSADECIGAMMGGK